MCTLFVVVLSYSDWFISAITNQSNGHHRPVELCISNLLFYNARKGTLTWEKA